MYHVPGSWLHGGLDQCDLLSILKLPLSFVHAPVVTGVTIHFCRSGRHFRCTSATTIWVSITQGTLTLHSLTCVSNQQRKWRQIHYVFSLLFFPCAVWESLVNQVPYLVVATNVTILIFTFVMIRSLYKYPCTIFLVAFWSNVEATEKVFIANRLVPLFSLPSPEGGSLAEMLPNSCIYCIPNVWVLERELWGCADDYSHHVVGLRMLDNGFYPCWPMPFWKEHSSLNVPTTTNSPAHPSCQTCKILNKSMVWL